MHVGVEDRFVRDLHYISVGEGGFVAIGDDWAPRCEVDLGGGGLAYIYIYINYIYIKVIPRPIQMFSHIYIYAHIPMHVPIFIYKHDIST